MSGNTQARWENGVVDWPRLLPGWQLSLDCSTETVDVGIQGEALRPIAAVPFVIRTSVVCPRVDVAEMSALALSALELITSRAIAREMWTGEITEADPFTLPGVYDWINPSPDTDQWTNPYLTQAGADSVTGVGGTDVLSAIAAVEAEVARRIVGGPIYIHMPAELVTSVAQNLETRGELILTKLGSIIVADPGYPFTSPTTIYGTGPVRTWVGSKTVDDIAAEVVSHDDNTVRVWASRPAMYLFDPRSLVTAEIAAPA